MGVRRGPSGTWLHRSRLPSVRPTARLADPPHLTRVAAVVLLLASISLLDGCVYREHRVAKEAQDAYYECHSRNPRDPSECETLRKRYEMEVERYEEISRRAWSCDPAQDECPTPR